MGTDMVACGSTFRPHQGRVIGDLSRLLYAVWYVTEALVNRDYPREAAAYTCLTITGGLSA